MILDERNSSCSVHPRFDHMVFSMSVPNEWKDGLVVEYRSLRTFGRPRLMEYVALKVGARIDASGIDIDWH